MGQSQQGKQSRAPMSEMLPFLIAYPPSVLWPGMVNLYVEVWIRNLKLSAAESDSVTSPVFVDIATDPNTTSRGHPFLLSHFDSTMADWIRNYDLALITSAGEILQSEVWRLDFDVELFSQTSTNALPLPDHEF
jgi:hypothetical protein